MALRPTRWLAMATVVAAGALSVVEASAVGTVATAAPQHTVAPVPFYETPLHAKTLPTPPTTALCQTQLGINCYNPAQLAKAYNLNGLHSAGIDGRGKTIVIVDAFGSPTIQSDLHTF